MRKQFFLISIILIISLTVAAIILPSPYLPAHYTLSIILGLLILLGISDSIQTSHSIRRNFPLIGRFRYVFESVRPEIQQYFIEKNTDGMPFSREERSVIYQRSKADVDTLPFGTQLDVYSPGYEWVKHSIIAKHVDPAALRVTIGGSDCTKPYSASILNISAMSYGALSKNAVIALNGGARDGGFAQNTGEGSLTPYHLSEGGDLIWQIGTGYFGCRDTEGSFDATKFAEKARLDNVKMIEIKISQGAKPGHGGILPKEKITPEIAAIRGVPFDRDVISPPSHSAFSTPIELLQFVKQLRELSGGKPVGFKLCIGIHREFIAICKAMVKTGIKPDFITVDGGEGGTGAAPMEFSNHIGEPSIDGLVFVHNCLNGFDLRKEIRLISSGKITTGFGLVKRIAIGADLCNSARGMMLALGCIQALRCNTNNCPTGVATQNPNLVAGLVVSDKRKRVQIYHEQTLKSAAEIIGSMGLPSTTDLKPYHVVVRIGNIEKKTYYDIYNYVSRGAFLRGEIPEQFKCDFENAASDSFDLICGSALKDDPVSASSLTNPLK
ncbi:FMN-binding glutamate synthase family protein [Oryzomonas rubra]|uniref:FMN-binding glutamate synthase family protein n=1 Tax=Oryzomonas rubra TaxID=2509454 RepID=A0A5A9X4P3_9BACT|nr:FMN-binding glutamate synthase family protein [Oryzomonas rubra]KAA0887960.1 FMN-binding glutamate synthase family protein [Oryzomonas rubra]